MIPTTIAGSLPKPAWLAEPERLWAPWRLEGTALTEGQQDAADPPQRGENKALDQQLSHEPEASGAERGANRDLPPAHRRAREQ